MRLQQQALEDASRVMKEQEELMDMLKHPSSPFISYLEQQRMQEEMKKAKEEKRSKRQEIWAIIGILIALAGVIVALII